MPGRRLSTSLGRTREAGGDAPADAGRAKGTGKKRGARIKEERNGERVEETGHNARREFFPIRRVHIGALVGRRSPGDAGNQ